MLLDHAALHLCGDVRQLRGERRCTMRADRSLQCRPAECGGLIKGMRLPASQVLLLYAGCCLCAPGARADCGRWASRPACASAATTPYEHQSNEPPAGMHAAASSGLSCSLSASTAEVSPDPAHPQQFCRWKHAQLRAAEAGFQRWHGGVQRSSNPRRGGGAFDALHTAFENGLSDVASGMSMY